MDSSLYISFLLASVVLILIPGPNVLVIISTSAAHGSQRGLQTVLGTSSAMVIQLFIAAIGTAWFVETLSEGLQWLKYLGITYLLYLGGTHFYKMLRPDATPNSISASGSFSRGFLVSLTNPKTIFFFGAFLPQFVSTGHDYEMQIVMLSITFLILACLLDSLYALLAGKLQPLMHNQNLTRIQNGLSGTLFISAGVWLAIMRKN